MVTAQATMEEARRRFENIAAIHDVVIARYYEAAAEYGRRKDEYHQSTNEYLAAKAIYMAALQTARSAP